MKYSMTLYFYPSPCGVDWRSPHHLTRSVILNALTFRPRSIGHVSIALKKNDELVDFVGMAAQNNNDNRVMILRDQVGMGVLFEKVPGRIEEKSKLIPELDKRLKSGYLSFWKLDLSKASFEKVQQYAADFRKNNRDAWYGLWNRPRYGEGSGCSAFAASFLEIAGTLENDFIKNCSLKIKVQEEFIGEKKADGKKVPIWALLLPNQKNTKWCEENSSGRWIYFWDPDLMHRWVLEKFYKNDSTFQPIKEQNALGLYSNMENRQPIDEPIWKV